MTENEIINAQIKVLDDALNALMDVQQAVVMDPNKARDIIDAKNSIMDKIEELVIVQQEAENV